MKYTIVNQKGRIIAIINSDYYISQIYKQGKGFFRESRFSGKCGPAYEIVENFTFGDNALKIVILNGYTIEQELDKGD
jgi:hypothetical protein